MRPTVLIIVLSVAIGAVAAGQEAVRSGSGTVAVVDYLEGSPQAIRDGEPVYAGVDFGFPVENFDWFHTGAADLLHMRTVSGIGVDARIEAQPDTSFYIVLSPDLTSQRAVVMLLSGTVSVDVHALSLDSDFQVQSGNVVMSVRGTRFTVTRTAAGDLLVTCDEGRVVCRSGDGELLFATPQSAVERTGSDLFRNTMDDGPAGVLRRNWISKRIDALEKDPLPVVKGSLERYSQLKERFNLAFAALLSGRETLENWMKRDRLAAAAVSDETEKAVPPEALEALATIMPLQAELEEVIRSAGKVEEFYNRGVLELTQEEESLARALFREVTNDRRLLLSRIATVRYILKLYAAGNGGMLPGDVAASNAEGAMQSEQQGR